MGFGAVGADPAQAARQATETPIVASQPTCFNRSDFTICPRFPEEIAVERGDGLYHSVDARLLVPYEFRGAGTEAGAEWAGTKIGVPNGIGNTGTAWRAVADAAYAWLLHVRRLLARLRFTSVASLANGFQPFALRRCLYSAR